LLGLDIGVLLGTCGGFSLDLHEAFLFFLLLDLLLHGLIHLIEHLLVQLEDINLVACLLDATHEFLNFKLKRLNANGVLKSELRLVELLSLCFFGCKPFELVVEFFFLFENSCKCSLRLEELTADLVILALELGQLFGLLMDGNILVFHNCRVFEVIEVFYLVVLGLIFF